MAEYAKYEGQLCVVIGTHLRDGRTDATIRIVGTSFVQTVDARYLKHRQPTKQRELDPVECFDMDEYL